MSVNRRMKTEEDNKVSDADVAPAWRRIRAERHAEMLAEMDTRYDEEEQLLASKEEQGHHLISTLDYALICLQAGDDLHRKRAETVLERCLEFMVTDPTDWLFGTPDRTYLEEPWARPPYAPFASRYWHEDQARPDWNSADFHGIRLARIVAHHADQLDPELLRRIKDRLGDAAWAIFRRNVGADYTNIAVFGGGVTAAAGELLDEPRLLDYGRRRLSNVLALYRETGQFAEYNSPTYTPFALQACEDILDISSDPETRAVAETLRRLFWKSLAEHFHPVTGQYAGPMFRAYNDRLNPGAVDYIMLATGVDIVHEQRGRISVIRNYRKCPEALIDCFRRLPRDEVEFHECFIRRQPDEWSTRGVTWLAREVTLGSANHEGMSRQRRPVLGYWRTEEEPAVVLRLRFLQDGRDRGWTHSFNDQKRNCVLSAMVRQSGGAEDDPEWYRIGDLRMRYELQGRGVSVRRLDTGSFELSAGDYRAVVHPVDGVFGPYPVKWETGSSEHRAWVDAVCYEGEAKLHDFPAFERIIVGGGLEILRQDQAPTTTGPKITEFDTDEQNYHLTWKCTQGELRVKAPLKMVDYYDPDTFPANAKKVPEIPY